MFVIVRKTKYQFWRWWKRISRLQLSTSAILVDDIIIRVLIMRTPYWGPQGWWKFISCHLPLDTFTTLVHIQSRVPIYDSWSTFCDSFCDKHVGFASNMWQCIHLLDCHKCILYIYDSSLLLQYLDIPVIGCPQTAININYKITCTLQQITDNRSKNITSTTAMGQMIESFVLVVVDVICEMQTMILFIVDACLVVDDMNDE